MQNKYIFLDLDGTLIDHSTNQVPESAKKALQLLKENGHTVFIATGRPPALLYGIEKELGIDSWIAANGRIVTLHNEIIYNKPIDKETVADLVSFAESQKIDIGFESFDDYVVQSRYTDLVDKFSDLYHLHYPKIHKDYYLDHDVYQMILFYNKPDFKKFEELYPSLRFNFSNEYGLDINELGGLKDIGIQAVMDRLGIDKSDIIAVGDGFNDISMIEMAGIGIAMGNAPQAVKDASDLVADNVNQDGLFKIFKQLKLI